MVSEGGFGPPTGYAPTKPQPTLGHFGPSSLWWPVVNVLVSRPVETDAEGAIRMRSGVRTPIGADLRAS